MASDRQLLNFIVEKDLLNRLDDFRFQNRFATRSGAIKWLLNWALVKNPSFAEPPSQAVEIPALPKVEMAAPTATPVPFPLAGPIVDPPGRSKSEPSHESTIQALKAQGYEVGETAVQDGQVRLVVRSNDGSALVTVGQELHDLAAGRLSLAEIVARRRNHR